MTYSLHSKDSQILFLESLLGWHFFSISTNTASFQNFTIFRPYVIPLIPMALNVTSLSKAPTESSLRGKIPNNYSIIYYFKGVVSVLLQNLASVNLSSVLFLYWRLRLQLYRTFNIPWMAATLSWHYVLCSFIFCPLFLSVLMYPHHLSLLPFFPWVHILPSLSVSVRKNCERLENEQQEISG